MKLFVTGATGFIGRHLTRRLFTTDHFVTCLVRQQQQITALEDSGAATVLGDLRDKASLVRGMAGCDCIINVAANISFWERDRRVYHDVNVAGTRNLMEAALEARVSKVVHVSAAGVLGKSASRPLTEQSRGEVPDVNDYIRTKAAGDEIAWKLHRERGLPLVVVYPVGVVGPGDESGFGPYVRNRVEGRMPIGALGDSILTLVHVKDVVEAVVRAAEKEDTVGKEYIVGKYTISMRDLDDIICEIAEAAPPRIRLPDSLVTGIALLLTRLSDLTGRPPPMGLSIDSVRMIRGGFLFDGSRAEKELGICYTPIRTALEDTVRWLRGEHP